MANTYSQIHIQIVIAVAYRDYAINRKVQSKIEMYITGVVKGANQKLLAINCQPDHCHMLIGLRPNCRISDLVKDIKYNSTKYINENRFVPGRFSWQEGYGAFSYSKSEIDSVIKYILNQEEHHRENSFQKEYMNLLNKSDIDYDPRYLFNF